LLGVTRREKVISFDIEFEQTNDQPAFFFGKAEEEKGSRSEIPRGIFILYPGKLAYIAIPQTQQIAGKSSMDVDT